MFIIHAAVRVFQRLWKPVVLMGFTMVLLTLIRNLPAINQVGPELASFLMIAFGFGCYLGAIMGCLVKKFNFDADVRKAPDWFGISGVVAGLVIGFWTATDGSGDTMQFFGHNIDKLFAVLVVGPLIGGLSGILIGEMISPSRRMKPTNTD